MIAEPLIEQWVSSPTVSPYSLSLALNFLTCWDIVSDIALPPKGLKHCTSNQRKVLTSARGGEAALLLVVVSC